MSNEDIRNFNQNSIDYGAVPLDVALTSEQKKIATLSMALNATLVQFINEGLFSPDQMIHFIGHLQDFTQRIYEGENLQIPNTHQTLQINSKAGMLFAEATESAFLHGKETFIKIKAAMDAATKAQPTASVSDLEEFDNYGNNLSKPTFN